MITVTHYNYFFICKRKLWLFANNIQMEHTNDNVTAGKQIHENFYKQRASKYQEGQKENDLFERALSSNTKLSAMLREFKTEKNTIINTQISMLLNTVLK